MSQTNVWVWITFPFNFSPLRIKSPSKTFCLWIQLDTILQFVVKLNLRNLNIGIVLNKIYPIIYSTNISDNKYIMRFSVNRWWLNHLIRVCNLNIHCAYQLPSHYIKYLIDD